MKKHSFWTDLWENIKFKKRQLLYIVFTSLLTQGLFILLPVITQNILDNNVSNISNKVWFLTNKEDHFSVNGLQLNQDDHNSQIYYSIVNIDDTYYLIKDFNYKSGSIKMIMGKDILLNDGQLLHKDDMYVLTKNDVQSLYNYQKKKLNSKLNIYIILSLILPFIAFINSTLVRKFSREVSAKFRERAARKIFNLPMSYFDNVQSGKFITYIIQDVSMFYNFSLSILIQLLQSSIMFIGIYFVLYNTDKRIFLASLIILPLICIWIYLYKSKLGENFKIARSYVGLLNVLLNEQFKGQRIIRAFNNQKFAYEEFNYLNQKYYESSIIPIRYRAFTSGSLVNVIRRNLWIFILIYSSFSYFGYIKVGITAGSIYLLISLVNNYMDPMYQIFGIISMLEQAKVSIDRYFNYINSKEEKEENKVKRSITYDFKGEVQFKNITFSYSPGKPVLNKINFHVSPHTKVAVVGKTGSGKSSLMNLLLRFYDDYIGEITLDGIDIKQVNKKQYRKNISVILQSPKLFKGTLKDNITWGKKEIDDYTIISLLKDLGAHNILNKKDGIYQEVSVGGSNFSIGERQQISFARAILNDPCLLILDEATANIDTYTERLLQKALDYASNNRTTFIIAHRLSTIKNADLIIVLENGQIVEKGTHKELIDKKAKYFAMYNAQINEQIGSVS